METRLVKFNIKNFVEDFILARESGDLDSEQELVDGFVGFFSCSCLEVQYGLRAYLHNNALAAQYPDLQDLTIEINGIF
jgi:hypothetical protein